MVSVRSGARDLELVESAERPERRSARAGRLKVLSAPVDKVEAALFPQLDRRFKSPGRSKWI